MIKSYKVRLEPTKEQIEMLYKTSGCARFVYNWCLNFQKERYEQGEKFVSAMGMSKYLTALKKQDEYSWLKEVDSIALVGAYTDACTSFKNFFRGCKKGKKVGYPKFKSKKHSTPSFMPRYDNIRFNENQVRLTKIGIVKLSRKNYVPIVKKYSNPRVTFDGLNWYISVGVEEAENISSELNGTIGIDLGVKDTAILSTGKKYKNINKTAHVKSIEKRLKKLQRQVSRKYEQNRQGKQYIKTNNIIKLEKEINKIYKRLANIRNNYNHNMTADIVNMNPAKIVIEDLNIQGMMKNKHLSNAIGKQGLYEITRQLEYKCKFKGIELVKADRFFPSSKTCSSCGYIKKDLKLSDRTYICPKCGNVIDRDLNAAINLANYKTEQ
jgi:putative transposase